MASTSAPVSNPICPSGIHQERCPPRAAQESTPCLRLATSSLSSAPARMAMSNLCLRTATDRARPCRDRSRSPQRAAVLGTIAQRLLHPASTLATTALWHTTLVGELALQDFADQDSTRPRTCSCGDQIEKHLIEFELCDKAQVVLHTLPISRSFRSRLQSHDRPTCWLAGPCRP